MTTNQSAGLNVTELPSAPAAIEAVSTSTFATCGWTSRGRTDAIIAAATDAVAQQRLGSYWIKSFIAYALTGYFQNGGGSALVQRVTPSDAVAASYQLGDAATSASIIGMALSNPVTTLNTTHYNAKIAIDGGSAVTVDVTGDAGVGGSYAPSLLATNIQAAMSGAATCVAVEEATLAGNVWRLLVTSLTTGATSTVAIEAAATHDTSLQLFGLKTANLPRTVTGVAEKTDRYDFTCLGAGVWGTDIQGQIVGDPNYKTSTGAYTQFNFYINEELNGDGNYQLRESYSDVVLDDDTNPMFLPSFVAGNSDYVSVTEGSSFGIPSALVPVQVTLEPIGTAVPNGSLTTFTGRLVNIPNRGTLTITTAAVTATDNGQGQISGTGVTSGTIDYTTGDVSITFSVAPTTADSVQAAYYWSVTDTVTFSLAGGVDGTGPITRSLVSDPALSATSSGIYAFNGITDQVLNFSLPDFPGSVAVHGDLIAWAEARKDIFVVLDLASGLSSSDAVRYVRDIAAFNSSYAATYWPWIKVPDSLANGNGKIMPPSGHVIGVYARTDATRTVAKAPAGVNDGALNNVVGFEVPTIPKSDRDIVYPGRVNPFIADAQTGRAVWGSRTLSLDKNWSQISVRRFFMFAEKSVYVNSWWTVFETTGPDLWSRITTSLNGFFRGLLNAGGYFPSKIESLSFQVVCNATNNQQSDIDAGQVNVAVGLAKSVPGEFIWFYFSQLLQAST